MCDNVCREVAGVEGEGRHATLEVKRGVGQVRVWGCCELGIAVRFVAKGAGAPGQNWVAGRKPHFTACVTSCRCVPPPPPPGLFPKLVS